MIICRCCVFLGWSEINKRNTILYAAYFWVCNANEIYISQSVFQHNGFHQFDCMELKWKRENAIAAKCWVNQLNILLIIRLVPLFRVSYNAHAQHAHQNDCAQKRNTLHLLNSTKFMPVNDNDGCTCTVKAPYAVYAHQLEVNFNLHNTYEFTSSELNARNIIHLMHWCCGKGMMKTKWKKEQTIERFWRDEKIEFN